LVIRCLLFVRQSLTFGFQLFDNSHEVEFLPAASDFGVFHFIYHNARRGKLFVRGRYAECGANVFGRHVVPDGDVRFVGEKVRDGKMRFGKGYFVKFDHLANACMAVGLVGADGVAVFPIGRKHTFHEFIVAIFVPTFLKPEPDSFLVFFRDIQFFGSRALAEKKDKKGQTEQKVGVSHKEQIVLFDTNILLRQDFAR